MFVDIAKVLVRAGRGGNGVVSLRHENMSIRAVPMVVMAVVVVILSFWRRRILIRF